MSKTEENIKSNLIVRTYGKQEKNESLIDVPERKKKKKTVFLNVTILQYKFVSIRTRPKCRSIKFFLYSSYTQEDNFELFGLFSSTDI